MKEVPEDQLRAIREALFRGRKIEAIKLYRRHAGLDLKDAKDAVDEMEGRLRAEFPAKFSADTGNKGCLGVIVLLVALAAAGYWFLGR